MLELGPTSLAIVWTIAGIAAISLLYGVWLRRQVLAEDEGTTRMREIARAVQEGAAAYLSRQFRTLGIFAAVAFGLLLLLPGDLPVRLGRSAFFLVGAGFSAAIGYLGMWLAVRANVRVAAAAMRANGRVEGAKIAFRTGGVVGMSVVGLGLLGAAAVVLLYREQAPSVLEGFGFGAALLAMFMRVGGGIFTKAADVGADLVGKVEQSIPEDDPRNAATIADNVGDNVGDCAGMAADLFESYAVTLVAALILGKAAFGEQGLVFPLLVPAIGALTAVLGIAITRIRGEESGLTAINRGFYTSAAAGAVLAAVAAFVYLPARFADLPAVPDLVRTLPGDPRVMAASAVAIGIVLAGVILWLTGYFTGTESNPTIHVARTSLTGPATVVLAGIGVGFESAVYTAGIIAAAICGVFLISGGSIILSLFMIALAGCGLLTTVGVIVAMDTFGPVSDNAQGIAVMSKDVDEQGEAILTALDADGNTTKAITKGIAIATAVLRAGHRRGHPGGRRDRVRGAPAVRRDPGHHDRPGTPRVRPGGRHLHQGLAARAGHPGAAGGVRADRGRVRPRCRSAGRLPGRRDRRRRADGGVPGQLRRLLGQREEAGRGRPLRRQELRRARRDRDRRHRRRPVQGHRRAGDQPADQGDEPGRAADRAGGGRAVGGRGSESGDPDRDRAGRRSGGHGWRGAVPGEGAQGGPGGTARARAAPGRRHRSGDRGNKQITPHFAQVRNGPFVVSYW